MRIAYVQTTPTAPGNWITAELHNSPNVLTITRNSCRERRHNDHLPGESQCDSSAVKRCKYADKWRWFCALVSMRNQQCPGTHQEDSGSELGICSSNAVAMWYLNQDGGFMRKIGPKPVG